LVLNQGEQQPLQILVTIMVKEVTKGPKEVLSNSRKIPKMVDFNRKGMVASTIHHHQMAQGILQQRDSLSKRMIMPKVETINQSRRAEENGISSLMKKAESTKFCHFEILKLNDLSGISSLDSIRGNSPERRLARKWQKRRNESI
jgi:hypothetical protein